MSPGADVADPAPPRAPAQTERAAVHAVLSQENGTAAKAERAAVAKEATSDEGRETARENPQSHDGERSVGGPARRNVSWDGKARKPTSARPHGETAAAATATHDTKKQDGWRNKKERQNEKILTIPKSMIFLDRKLLWCPNAKAGTTSIYLSVLRPTGIATPRNMNGERCYENCPLSAWKIDQEGDWAARKAVRAAPSFTVVRNPWDRLRSCYEGKIITKKLMKRIFPGMKQQALEKMTWKEKWKIVPMTFLEFVEHVEKNPNEDNHWAPHSQRCRLVGRRAFNYTHVLRLEDGLFEQVERLFGRYGLPFPAVATQRAVRSNATRAADGDGAAARDRALRNFYEGAATPAVSARALVRRVGRIYAEDVSRHGYAFPWPAE